MMAFGSGQYRQMAWEILHEELGIAWSDDFRGAMFIPREYHGIVSSKEHVKCVLGWGHFIGKTCSLSVIIREPQYLTRQVLREAFRFPFEVCDLNVLLLQIADNNLPSLTLARKTGFREVHCCRGGAADGANLVVFEMLRSECRWIKGESK